MLAGAHPAQPGLLARIAACTPAPNPNLQVGNRSGRLASRGATGTVWCRVSAPEVARMDHSELRCVEEKRARNLARRGADLRTSGSKCWHDCRCWERGPVAPTSESEPREARLWRELGPGFLESFGHPLDKRTSPPEVLESSAHAPASSSAPPQRECRPSTSVSSTASPAPRRRRSSPLARGLSLARALV